MKFYKDRETPLIKIGSIVMFAHEPIKVIRLSDGFLHYRQNKPKKGSELWDKTKYKIMEREYDREKREFFYKEIQ